MGEPDFEQARRYALRRLERELDPALCYHSIAHTRDEVVPAAERLAALEGFGGEDLMLLRTAAYFHDIGFVECRAGHEATGVRIVEAALPGFGYAPDQVAAIGQLILATRLPQRPITPLAAILADSDLDMLGREDFLLLNRMLRTELDAFGAAVSDAQWYRQQANFVRSHHYWTASARRLRDDGKGRNLRALEALLAVAEGISPQGG
ncbi:MAG: HD domain-containing protein [Chloroflexales bacterium]|nr:HD domain-containing protein [Chloroflexales bacterium]